MKENLVALINDIPKIEGLFCTLEIPDNVAMFPTEHISNVPEFQIWRQRVLRELHDIYKVNPDDFIKGTIDCLSKELNSWHERKDFNIIKGKLLAIKDNIEIYYISSSVSKSAEKSPLIFISHSNKDKEYAEQIIELFEVIGLTEQHVFCSSVPGYDIKLGNDIYAHLRTLFQTRSLHIVYLLSKNFYNSPASLNEMGAAWVLKNEATSILLPGFEFEEIKGVVNNREIAIKLDGDELEVKDKLTQLYDKIVEEFALNKKGTIFWERKRDAFIQKIKEISERKQKSTVKKTYGVAKISQEAIELLHNATQGKDALIIITHNLGSGKCIQAGIKSYSEAMGIREFSKWDAGFDELLNNGYIKAIGKKGEIFQVTDEGFKFIEE